MPLSTSHKIVIPLYPTHSAFLLITGYPQVATHKLFPLHLCALIESDLNSPATLLTHKLGKLQWAHKLQTVNLSTSLDPKLIEWQLATGNYS